MLRILLLVVTVLPLAGQAVHPVTGRRIADVMGFSGAPWLIRSEREAEEAPDRALDAIGIGPCAVLADIGAGVGYFTWRMAERTGPAGKVYAVDIQPRMLEELRKNLEKRHITNVERVLGAIDDPRLPASAIDMALLVDVYHEFSEPQKMLQGIRAALKPDGRLVLLEYRKEDPSIPIRPEHKMSVAEVTAEIEPEGFRLERTSEVLPRQHIFIFRKSSPPAALKRN